MTARASVALAAAFLATGVSIDPRVAGSTSEKAAIDVAPEPRATPHAPATRHVIGSGRGPAPSDLTVQVTPDRLGAFQVIVHRPGFLVSVRDQGARSAGADWTALRVGAASAGSELQGELVWETTKLDGSDTTRGILALYGARDPLGERSLGTELSVAAPPEPLGTWKGKHASCVSQHDGFDGFTVFCRPASGVRLTGVANVTAPRPLDDAWLVSGSKPWVRLDLAHSPGGAEGRVIGLVHGATGVVLTVEASFPEGEASSLVFHEAERPQPTPL